MRHVSLEILSIRGVKFAFLSFATTKLANLALILQSDFNIMLRFFLIFTFGFLVIFTSVASEGTDTTTVTVPADSLASDSLKSLPF